MENELLVKSIRDLCKKNNIAISQLETELNFGAGLISRWNKNSPSIDKIVDIADFFHVSLDEVVGYNQNINDEFINKLYEKTDTHEIIWGDIFKNGSLFPQIKIHEECPSVFYEEDKYNEIQYAIAYNKGYVTIYAFYQYGTISKPIELKLFIQPSYESSLVEQIYPTNILLKLWIKILNNLGNDTPDEVKAEDFKNSFISNNKGKDDNINNLLFYPNNVDIEKILENESIMNLYSIYNSPEFQELQNLFNDPEFDRLMRIIKNEKTK